VVVLYAQHHEAPTVIHDPRLGNFVLGQVNVKFRSGVLPRVEGVVHDVDGQILRRVEELGVVTLRVPWVKEINGYESGLKSTETGFFSRFLLTMRGVVEYEKRQFAYVWVVGWTPSFTRLHPNKTF
jgi:hypothetical protein